MHQHLAILQIEEALLRLPCIDDCAVLVRRGDHSHDEIVAYLTVNEPFATDEIHAQLKAALPGVRLPDVYQTVVSLPLTPIGELDEQALSDMPVVDHELAQRWEERLQMLPSVEHVAVVTHAQLTTSPPLHLADVLPEWPRDWSRVRKDKSSTQPPTVPLPQPSPQGLHSETPAIQHGGVIGRTIEGDKIPATLPEMLRRTASRAGAGEIVFVQMDGSEIRQSYNELLTVTERIAAGLRKQGVKPRHQIILQLTLNEDILPAFWACLLGGFVPVIMAVPPTYTDTHKDVEKLSHVWRVLDQPFILTSEAQRESIQALSQWIPIQPGQIGFLEYLRQNAPGRGDDSGSKPDDTAFLSLTSGSTGAVKCIMLTHRNILARARGTNVLCRHEQSDVILNWLPFDHIGSISDWHLRCVELGCRLIYAPTQQVLGNPLNWLRLIHQYRITHSWAPNFAYTLINEALQGHPQADWDLSCVKSLLTAGEPVSSETVNDFLSRLTPYGLPRTALRPAFGMAELGSGITYFQPTEETPVMIHSVDRASLTGSLVRVEPNHPQSIAFTSLGPVIPGVSIRIVNDHDSVLPENTIGHLQVKGAAVSPGYYKDPEANEQVFLKDGWFNTGDRGFIANAQLYVTGRDKETVIINGVNYYSREIELAVEEVDGIAASFTAACAVRPWNADTEHLAIFFHSPIADDARLVQLIRNIQAHVTKKVGVKPDYLLPVEQNVIPKTSIGKIQRKQLTLRFESGECDDLVKHVDILLRNKNTLPNWFYELHWRPKLLRHGKPSTESRSYLVLSDTFGLGSQMCHVLTEAGHSCVQVERGEVFSKRAVNHYVLNPLDPDQYHRLLEEMAETKHGPTHIFHLWSYSAYDGEPIDLHMLERDLGAGCYSLLYLIQALASRRADSNSIRLLLASSYAQTIAKNDQVCCARAVVPGLLKAMAQELPWLSYRHIDLDLPPETLGAHEAEDVLQAAVKRLLEEDAHPQGDAEVAFRGARRFVPYLAQVDWSQARRSESAFQKDGMYLITGGLGGIGVELARHLLTRLPVRLLLVGRTPLPQQGSLTDQTGPDYAVASRVSAMRELERLGEVHYAPVDVGDFAGLRQAVEEAESHWGCQLTGVIHLAGVFHERLMLEESKESLSEMFSSKLVGALAVHQLVKDKSGSLIIHFSSIASIFGGRGLGAYAAANRFLDSLSYYQRQRDLKSYCFNWSFWDGVGMNRDNTAKGVLRTKGFQAISTEQGLHSLFAGLLHEPAQLLVGLDGENGNIQKSMEWIDQSRQMITAYITTKDGAVVEEEIEHLSLPDRFGIPTRCSPWRIDDMPLTDSGDVDTTRLQALASGVMYEPVSPQTPLEESLAKIWAEVLGVNTVGIHDDFFEIGGDSMRAARLLATIKQELDFSLPLDALFQHPSVAEFSKAIQDGTLSANGPVTALLKQSNDAQHLLLKPTLLGQMSDAYQRLVRTIGLKLKSLLN